MSIPFYVVDIVNGIVKKKDIGIEDKNGNISRIWAMLFYFTVPLVTVVNSDFAYVVCYTVDFCLERYLYGSIPKEAMGRCNRKS